MDEGVNCKMFLLWLCLQPAIYIQHRTNPTCQQPRPRFAWILLIQSYAILFSQSLINGLFRKKSNRGVEDILYWNPPWNFSFFYFTHGNSRQNKAHPLEIPQIFVRSLGNFKAKNQDPRNSTLCFLDQSWKFHFFFN